MILRPPGTTRTATLFPYTTLFRSALRRSVDRLAVPAVRLVRPGTSGQQGSLPRILPAGAAPMACIRPSLRRGRRLEHRAPQYRPEKLAFNTEALRFPAA